VAVDENVSFEAPSKDMLAWRLPINEMRNLSVLTKGTLTDVFVVTQCDLVPEIIIVT